MAKQGTWNLFGVNLPDFSITERMGNLLGYKGSVQPTTFYNPKAGAVGQIGPAQGGNTINYEGVSTGQQHGPQLPYGPQLPSGGGGGGPTLSGGSPQPQQNPFGGMEQSARSQADIELEQALNEFDYQREGLLAESGKLDTQRAGALSTLETERGRAQKEAETAKTEAASATQTAKGKALSTAQDIVRKNRNVLRALGILSSSAGGEMLAKPMIEYGIQAGQLVQGLVDRLGKVEDWWMQRQQDFTRMKTDLETQYAQLKDNISRDLRFNDRQRLTAVKAAQAALQQRLKEIQSQVLSYQTAAKQYSDNILLQVAQLKMYQNPKADTSAIFNTLLSQAQPQQPQQVAIAGGLTEEQKRNQGLLGSPGLG